MATNFQSVDDRLTQIKTTLQGISSNLSASTPEQRKQLSGAFTNLSGTLSSEQARRSVSSARESAPGTTSNATGAPDPMARALQEKAQSEARAKEAEARRKEAEATASIADQRMMKGQTNAGASSTAGADGKGPSPEETKRMRFQELMQAEPMLADYGLTEENLEDPMVIATLRNQVAQSKQLEADAVRLSEMVQRKEERTQQQVALVGQSIKNQEAQLKVEQRKRMAAEGMGSILAGRSLYSPEEHQGLIQEIVQDGILKLQEIQIEGFKLQNEMWDDFENYEYEAYTQKSEMLKEFNKLELDTVTSIQTRLQALAKSEQEKLVFDQAQMDRASLIMAEELVGASDEAIREAATTQGIDYGLLKRAVADATEAQEMRAFNREDRALSLTGKRLSIAGQQRALSGGSGGGDGRFTEAELGDIEAFAQEMIDNSDFKITNVPQALRAAVIAKRNELEGNADTAEFIETGGASFIGWLNEDKTRTKFVKVQVADKLKNEQWWIAGNISSMFTSKGMDVARAINSEAGQTAVQIAIEQGAKSNEEIYSALFGSNGLMIEYVKEEAENLKKNNQATQTSANSTPAFR